MGTSPAGEAGGCAQSCARIKRAPEQSSLWGVSPSFPCPGRGLLASLGGGYSDHDTRIKGFPLGSSLGKCWGWTLSATQDTKQGELFAKLELFFLNC